MSPKTRGACVAAAIILGSATPTWAAPHKVLVGTSASSYALAYSPARHLFYHDGDGRRGWYGFYLDGTHIVSAFSPDGEVFSHHQIVSHNPVNVGFSVYEHQGVVRLLYTDTNHSMVFFRKGRVGEETIAFDPPVLAAESHRSFGAMSPTLAQDDHGVLWVAYRSNEGNNRFQVWLIHSKDREGASWSQPVALSSADEMEDSGAGTSGAPAFVSGELAVLWSGSRCLYMVDVPRRFLRAVGMVDDFMKTDYGEASTALYPHLVVDDAFSGIHDFSMIVADGSLHVAYLKAVEWGGTMMAYQRWSPRAGWDRRELVGPSGIHTTALGLDSLNRIWVFYLNNHELVCRSKAAAASSFGPPQVVATNENSYPWTAASASTYPGVGVMWVEGTQAPYQVFFTVLE